MDITAPAFRSYIDGSKRNTASDKTVQEQDAALIRFLGLDDPNADASFQLTEEEAIRAHEDVRCQRPTEPRRTTLAGAAAALLAPAKKSRPSSVQKEAVPPSFAEEKARLAQTFAAVTSEEAGEDKHVGADQERGTEAPGKPEDKSEKFGNKLGKLFGNKRGHKHK